MSFLKEFKDDLSQAVNELVEDAVATEKLADKVEKQVTEETAATVDADDNMVNTIDDDDFSVDVAELEAMLDDIDAEKAEEYSDEAMDIESVEEEIEEIEEDVEETEEVMDTDYEAAAEEIENVDEEIEETEMVEESVDMIEEVNADVQPEEVAEEVIASDEITDITKGTSISGNVESDGSINVYGKINGDISCKGKLVVTGRIKGTSNASEIFANNAKIEGEVHSTGTVKIGNGSIVVGNVYATSAVIGGAIKGDIDVKGPVIIDGTAVVQGNVKSRSVQINNGAVIEGFCSQCYADIDYKTLFEETFSLN